MKETWKDIPGYVGLYQVSDLGRVRSLDRIVNRGTVKQPLKGKLLSQKVSEDRQQPYLIVCLCRNGTVKYHYVHRLVASGFLSGRKREVNHKDLNKLNCRADNLEWSSSSANKKHAVTKGVLFNPSPRKGSDCGKSKLTEVEVLKIKQGLADKRPNKEIAAEFQISPVTVSDIKVGKTWTHVTL